MRKYLSYLFEKQYIMSIFKNKNEGVLTRTHLAIKTLKKLFDMVKGTKSSPISKRNGVKNEYLLVIK
jgi:hypothetical protein